MNEVAARIEDFLLTRRGWVKAEEICHLFAVKKRALRKLDDKPGLVGDFAISNSKRGYKHIAAASDAEFLHSYRAMRKHAIGEMVHARALRRRRERLLRNTKTPPPMTRDGQALLSV